MFDLSKHRFILVQILKDVYSDGKLGRYLGFKGGTACYLFYNLPRFSVDLDFTLIDKGEKDEVFEKVKGILEKYGKLTEAREKRFTLFFLLSYGREIKNIKVGISKRNFPDNYQVKNYLSIPVLVMKKEDIFAHKLVALLERINIANRDLFDLWYFMKNHWTIDKELVEVRTKEKFKSYLRECIVRIEKVNEKYILQGLGEVLDNKQKEWVRKNLKEELIFLMKYYLNN